MIQHHTDAVGLEYIEVSTPACHAVIYLEGGQLASWTPAGQEHPVIWRSPLAVTGVPGKSLRGGIPVCWPWFGPLDREGCPAHGFARNHPWHLLDSRQDGEDVELLLFFGTQGTDCWPHAAELALHLRLGHKLEAGLSTRNTGDDAFGLGQALHSYFAVSDVATTRVQGLDGVAYIDKVDGLNRKTQQGAVSFAGETDRVYLDTGAMCSIVDPGFGRIIEVGKEGSRSTVIWNPWDEKGRAMADLGEHWRNFICVEAGNALEDVVTVAPGEHHVLRQTVQVRAAG